MGTTLVHILLSNGLPWLGVMGISYIISKVKQDKNLFATIAAIVTAFALLNVLRNLIELFL